MSNQKTLADSITLKGVGIHSSLPVCMTLCPAAPDTGVVFKRVDATPPVDIPAAAEAVAKESPLRQTTLTREGKSVKTIEHLMAALYAAGVTNVIVEIDQEEVPAMDGGAQDFWDAIRKTGVVEQSAMRRVLSLKEPIYISNHKSSSLIAFPSDVFRVSYTLSYGTPDLFDQYYDVVINEQNFAAELAGARTFCLRAEAEALRAAGFGKGASVANTLVFEKNVPIQNTLRYPNEAVRHKIVDLIGDLSLLGVELRAHVVALRTGHSQNLELVKAIHKHLCAEASESGSSDSRRLKVVESRQLDIFQIQHILPHRYPFLLVDRVLDLEPRKRAVAIKNVTINEPFFQGHFPGHPVMPGVLIVEAMAQVSGLIMLNTPENIGKLAYFMSIGEAKFRWPVVPGDQIRFEVEVLKWKTRYGSTQGRAYVNDKLACEAELKFSFVDK